MPTKKRRQKREHIKTSATKVFIHAGKNSKRLQFGFFTTEAQERRLYELLKKRYPS
jgi:hypothetical protein